MPFSACLAIIGQLISLKGLRISWWSDISPSGLAPLWSLTNLDTLALPWSRLDQQGLSRLASLRNLRRLSLVSTCVGSEEQIVPQAWPPGLEDLWLDCRGLPESADLSSLSRLSHLKVLALEEMKITEITSQIADASALTNKGLNHLKSLPCLRVLKVWPENQVTEEALKALRRDRPSLRWERIRSAP